MFSRALKPVFMARFSLGPVAQPAPVPPGMAIGRPVADIADIAHDAHRHRNAVERVDLVFASVIPEEDPSDALGRARSALSGIYSGMRRIDSLRGENREPKLRILHHYPADAVENFYNIIPMKHRIL